MWQMRNSAPRIQQRALSSLLLIGVLTVGSIPGFSRGPRPETIEATAMGTGTHGYSTPKNESGGTCRDHGDPGL
jgi:hypothetical protein